MRIMSAKEAYGVSVKNYLEKYSDIKTQYLEKIAQVITNVSASGRFDTYVELPAALVNQWKIVESIISRLKEDGYKANRTDSKLYIDWSSKNGNQG